MKIEIDLDLLLVEDLEEIESGQIARIRPVLGRFVRNGDGEYMPAEEGAEKLKKLSVKEFMKQARALTQQIKEAVPSP